MLTFLVGGILGLQILMLLRPLRSGGDGFNEQDRIDVYTIMRRTSEIMAQIDDLMSALQTISSDVDNEVSRLQQLQDQLTQLQNTTPPSVDLQPAIDLASSIRQRLEGTATTAADTAATTSSDTGAGVGSGDIGSGSQPSDTVVGVAGDASSQPAADVTSGDASADPSAVNDPSQPPSE